MTNSQLLRFITRFWEPYTHSVDTLSQTDLKHENNYVNLPFCVTQKALALMSEERETCSVDISKICVPASENADYSSNSNSTVQCKRSCSRILPKEWRICALRICGDPSLGHGNGQSELSKVIFMFSQVYYQVILQNTLQVISFLFTHNNTRYHQCQLLAWLTTFVF